MKIIGGVQYQIEAPPSYFVHVPKTGGITLGSFLEKVYFFKKTVRLTRKKMAKLSLDEFKHFTFYHSLHQGRPLLELTERSDLACFTMLKDPVERTISQILYLQRTVSKAPHTFTVEYLERIKPILDSNLTALLDVDAFGIACDSQLRTLGYREDYTPLFSGNPDAVSGRTLIRPYSLPALMDPTDQKLLMNNACEWLSTMNVVGITEHYDESVRLICDVLGIAPPSKLPRKNANPARITSKSGYRGLLSPYLISQIEDLTQQDKILYNHANELFKEQWARFQSKPSRTFSILPRVTQKIKQSQLVKFLGPVRRWMQ